MEMTNEQAEVILDGINQILKTVMTDPKFTLIVSSDKSDMRTYMSNYDLRESIIDTGQALMFTNDQLEIASQIDPDTIKH